MRLVSVIFTALLFTGNQTAFANTFKTEKWSTQNGVSVVFYQAMEVPMLDLSMAFAAGSAHDGQQFGISALTTNLLNQGSDGLDASAIADALAENGAQFSAETSRDMVVFNLRTLTSKDALDQAIKTYTQIIGHPAFSDEAFTREKQQLLMAIEQAQESPDDVANISFFNNLYGDHPYAHPVNGTEATVKLLQKNQIINFYKQFYVPENAVLVMVGAIDNQRAHQIAEQITNPLKHGKAADLTPKAKPLSKANTIHLPFPSSQTMVRLGQIGITHQNPHYFSLVLGNYILGGSSLVSRLGTEVREKHGLTYGIDSQFVPMPGEGPFLISLSTKKQEVNKAIGMTNEVLRNFIKEGPDQNELDAAKQYLTGSFPLSLSSNKTIATLLLRMAFYHLPDDFLDTYVQRINAVTISEIKDAFNEQINPNKLLMVTVGRS